MDAVLALTFPAPTADNPVIGPLVKHCALDVNILKAHIEPNREGRMTIAVSGSQEALDCGLAFLKQQGVLVAPASQGVVRDEKACIHCGLCSGFCPVDALSLDEKRLLVYKPERCTACGFCTIVCPVKAMRLEKNGL